MPDDLDALVNRFAESQTHLQNAVEDFLIEREKRFSELSSKTALPHSASQTKEENTQEMTLENSPAPVSGDHCNAK